MAKDNFRVKLKNIRTENFGTGISGGDDLILHADGLEIINAQTGIVVGNRAILDLKRTIIDLSWEFQQAFLRRFAPN